MNLIELRDKINEQIKLGLGHSPVVAKSSDGEYEKVNDISFEKKDCGYISCYSLNFDCQN